MKTIKSWLEELPEPYRSQALENLVKDSRENTEVKSLSVAISSAFVWKDTSQGEYYWMNVGDGGLPDVTVKTVNEEAVIKSNREIAEEITNEFSSHVMNSYSEQQDIINKIESILNKYFKN